MHDAIAVQRLQAVERQDAPVSTVIQGADQDVESEGFRVSEMMGPLEITQV